MASKQPQELKVFVSIPDDLEDIRDQIKVTIETATNRVGETATFKVISWDKLPGYPGFKELYPGDDIVKDGKIERPSDCDIFIMAVWTKLARKFGEHWDDYEKVRTVANYNGVLNYSSEWEFQDARSGNKNGKPYQILFYECIRPIPRPLTSAERDERRINQTAVDALLDALDQARENRNLARPQREQFNEVKDFTRSLIDYLPAATRELVAWHSRSDAVVEETDRPKRRTDKKPFPGLEAFSAEFSEFFFGRTEDTSKLVNKFTKEGRHFVLVFGPSGSGKSSLVGAGLFPRLTETNWITSSPIKPGTHDTPVWALASALQELEAVRRKYPHTKRVVEQLQNDPAFLGKLADAALTDMPTKRLILFIDQFEELFTAVKDKTARTDFLKVLEQVPCFDRIDLIATVRADLVDEAMQISVIDKLFKNDLVFVSLPTRTQLLQMITGPVEEAGFHFEDQWLPDRIVNEVYGQSGAMSVIAYTLEQLYEVCKASGTFTYEAYQQLGGVNKIIAEHARKTLETLVNENYQSPEQLKGSLYTLFNHLATVTDESHLARRRAHLQSLTAHDPVMGELVNALSHARLLTVTRNPESLRDEVEVAHEALFESWDMLRDWSNEYMPLFYLRRQVEFSAQVWRDTLKNTIKERLEGEKELKELEHNFASETWRDALQAAIGQQLITSEEINNIDEQYLWKQERLQPVTKMYADLDIEPEEPVTSFITPEVDRLLAKLDNVDLTHHERVAISERLAQIRNKAELDEDKLKRLGIGCYPENERSQGVPIIAWSGEIEGGSTYVKNRYSEQWEPVTWDAFSMAYVPITYEHYRLFEESPGGYENDQWWYFPRPPQGAPHTQKKANYPVDNVTWYEALAFCRWLTDKHRAAGLLSEREVIRLPYSWEWEYAMRGSQEDWHYPWGPDFDARLCNTAESELGHTVAVGMYPDSYSRFSGVWDMFGNIAEWCSNADGETTFKRIDPNNIVKILTCGSSYRLPANRGYQRLERSDRCDASIGFRVIKTPIQDNIEGS